MVQITDQELLDELERCYNEHGEITYSILNNSSNDFPTQPTYSYRFDNGLRGACKKADVSYNVREKYTKEKIVEMANTFFQKNGELGLRNFNNSDELPSSNRLYSHFSGIDELIQETDYTEEIYNRQEELKEIVKEERDKHTKFNQNDTDALVEHLWWVAKEYGDAKTKNVDKAPGPSSQTYRSIFGSMPNARKEAGIKDFSNNALEYKIGHIPDNYDDSADGYVYVIRMIRKGEEYYYVGMSTSLRNRLDSHASGSSKVMLHHENKYDKMSELGLEPHCIVRVENYYQENTESEEEFRNRLKSEEHIVSHQISAAFNTDKVLGGRS